MTVPLHEPTTLPPADYGGNAQPNMTLDAIYADYKNSSAQLLPVRQQMVALAAKWGLKHTSYEAGPGWNVGCVRERSTRAVCRPPISSRFSTVNSLGNYIIAQRLAPMRDVWKYDVLSSWEVAGGDIYNQFSLFGEASRRLGRQFPIHPHPRHPRTPNPTSLCPR